MLAGLLKNLYNIFKVVPTRFTNELFDHLGSVSGNLCSTSFRNFHLGIQFRISTKDKELRTILPVNENAQYCLWFKSLVLLQWGA